MCKRSREQEDRLLLESTAKLDQGRANPVYIKLSTNLSRTIVKKKIQLFDNFSKNFKNYATTSSMYTVVIGSTGDTTSDVTKS